MQFAVYDKKEYRFYDADARRMSLVTGQEKKADDSFKFDGEFYEKKIKKKKVLSDIYDVHIWVKYTLDKEPEWWVLQKGGLSTLKEGAAQVWFCHDIVPAQQVEDACVYSTGVRMEDVEEALIAFTYTKKAGAECNPPELVKSPIGAAEIEKYYKRYYTNKEL